jgi:hypothetical protein
VGVLCVVYCSFAIVSALEDEMVVVSISFVTAHSVAPVRDTVFAGHAEHDARSDVVNDKISGLFVMTFEMSLLHSVRF